MITSILEVSGLELDFSGTKSVTFFGAQPSLEGHNSCLGSTSSDLGGTAPEYPSGVGLAASLLQFIEL